MDLLCELMRMGKSGKMATHVYFFRAGGVATLNGLFDQACSGTYANPCLHRSINTLLHIPK